MKEYGKLVKICQDDFDDGVQELVLKFSNGENVTQRRVWPDIKYRDGDGDDSLHEVVYYSNEFKELEKSNIDAAFALICKCSKLIDGIDLKPESIAVESFIGGKVEIKDQTVLHEHWFQVIEMSCRHSLWDGGWSEFKDHTFIKGREGVACVLYDKTLDKIVLIEEFRIGAVFEDSPWMVGIPTGGLEEGEDAQEGAKRECVEEAGLEPFFMEHMLTYKPSPGFTTHTQHLYYGLVDSTKAPEKVQGLDSEGEDIRVEVLDASEVRYQLGKKEFKNGTAITALQHFFMFHYSDAKNIEVS